MKLLLYGANKNTLPHEEEENFQIKEADVQKMLADFTHLSGVKEHFIYLNDFRMEFYFLVDEKNFKHGDFIRYLADFFEVETKEVILKTYSKFNMDVLEHLYNILAGVFSREDKPSKTMSKIESALDLAEKITHKKQRNLYTMVTAIIRSITQLKKEDRYIPLLSEDVENFIQKLVSFFESLKDKRLILFGSGEKMIEYGKHLHRLGFGHITLVANPTEDLKDRVDDLNQWAKNFDQDYLTRVFFETDQETLAFSLASSDGILVLDDYEADLPENLEEEIQLIRPYDKRQICLDWTGTFPFKAEMDPYIHFDKREDGTYSKQDIEKALEEFRYESHLEIGKIWVQTNK